MFGSARYLLGIMDLKHVVGVVQFSSSSKASADFSSSYWCRARPELYADLFDIRFRSTHERQFSWVSEEFTCGSFPRLTGYLPDASSRRSNRVASQLTSAPSVSTQPGSTRTDNAMSVVKSCLASQPSSCRNPEPTDTPTSLRLSYIP
jgi:hypothetical protein